MQSQLPIPENDTARPRILQDANSNPGALESEDGSWYEGGDSSDSEDEAIFADDKSSSSEDEDYVPSESESSTDDDYSTIGHDELNSSDDDLTFSESDDEYTEYCTEDDDDSMITNGDHSSHSRQGARGQHSDQEHNPLSDDCHDNFCYTSPVSDDHPATSPGAPVWIPAPITLQDLAVEPDLELLGPGQAQLYTQMNMLRRHIRSRTMVGRQANPSGAADQPRSSPCTPT